jgi:hypothetical protein
MMTKPTMMMLKPDISSARQLFTTTLNNKRLCTLCNTPFAFRHNVDMNKNTRIRLGNSATPLYSRRPRP